ncbi:hypothetical protein PWT90_02506 [Aphanocladium album]|nr:hypothetical protein PWT90_02506 [Aphanocladium album]
MQRLSSRLVASDFCALQASGPYAGEQIMQQPKTKQSSVVHRAAFLSALMAPLPQEMLHVSKKLASIDTSGSKVNVAFGDGTTETFDALIGADGIWGTVRRHVLQDAAAEHAATPAGYWDTRCLVPYEKAKEKLGAQYFTEYRQHGWCGDGGFILFDPLDNGETVQCIMSAVEKGHSDERGQPLTREILETTFKEWLDGPIAKNMIDGHSQCEHKSTPTYANGNVCIMGDAAHATTPWQGSGAGMAIEDAATLGALLGDAKTPADVAIAFQAFDLVRRPRCQKIVESSNGTGRLMCLQDEADGVDPSNVLALLAPRWNFIRAYDVEEDMAKAVARANELKSK